MSKSSRSTYARERKARRRDTYGEWKDGKRLTPEIVAGTVLTYTPGMW